MQGLSGYHTRKRKFKQIQRTAAETILEVSSLYYENRLEKLDQPTLEKRTERPDGIIQKYKWNGMV